MSEKGKVPILIDQPYADIYTRPFWTAALDGKVTAQECMSCGMKLLPPAPRCPVCRSAEFSTTELPGTGIVYSYIVVRHPLRPDLVEAVPYVSAVVEMDGTQGAGARMMVNIVDCQPEQVSIGDRVRIVFEKVNDSLAVPRAVLEPS